jgi:branched-chain amino acid transport system substrate-binding protein
VKTRTRVPQLLILLAAAVGVVACGGKPVVGVLLASSGEAASYGESMKEGLDLALDQAKANGGIPRQAQFVWADSATDPETAVREFKNLVGQGAHLVIAGVTSGEAKALLPVLDQTDTVCLSPSASAPVLTEKSSLFYRVFASDEYEGQRAGRFLYEDQDKRSVLIYTGDSEHARGIEPPFRHMFEQALGGKVVGKVIIGSPNWEQESADLLASSQPAAVYIIAYADKTLEVLRQLRAKGYQGVICVTSAFYSGQVVKDNPDLVEGVYFPQPAFDIQDERDLVRNFVKAFRDRYHSDPDIYAAHAYDTMRVVLQIIKITPVFQTPEIKKSLQFGLEEFPGVTGVIQFDERGDVRHPPIMFIVKGGQVQNYERYVKEQRKLIQDRIRKLLGNTAGG